MSDCHMNLKSRLVNLNEGNDSDDECFSEKSLKALGRLVLQTKEGEIRQAVFPYKALRQKGPITIECEGVFLNKKLFANQSQAVKDFFNVTSGLPLGLIKESSNQNAKRSALINEIDDQDLDESAVQAFPRVAKQLSPVATGKPKHSRCGIL